MIKINVSRGKYVTVDMALSMIDAALKEAILTLRRLPELARDGEERPRLEAFMNGVLDAIRSGAQSVCRPEGVSLKRVVRSSTDRDC